MLRTLIVDLLFYLFLLGVLGSALYCAVWPERTVAFRKRKGWSESILSGGYFYATPGRARFMGILLTVILAPILAIKVVELLR